MPWQDALAEVCRRLDGAGVDWWLTGSAALAVRGIPVTPGDLDLVVSDEDAHRVGDLLLDCLIEPVAPADWFCRWWGRAVLGARVEWVGGVGPSADRPEPTDFGLVAAARLETVRWREYDVRVPPLELQRAVSSRRGLVERVRLIDGNWQGLPPGAAPYHSGGRGRMSAMAEMSLEEIRAAIDAVDAELVRLLARRESLVRRAAPLKRDAPAVRAPDRVEQVIAQARAQAVTAGADPEVVERIYRAMVQAFIDMELAEHHRATVDKGVIE